MQRPTRGGDLAYAYGTYVQILNDRNGKPVNDRGKFVTVFRHEPDGKCKAVVDIFNSDLSAPVPETK